MTSKSFIEIQFPVSKLSAESYKEREAKQGQTLTRLGKWWGRKPLILVRATLLGILLPASDNPQKDAEIFYKILTLDENGLKKRRRLKSGVNTPPITSVFELALLGEREEHFELKNEKISFKRGLSKDIKFELQERAFKKLPYSERIKLTLRPEQIDGPEAKDIEEINAYLGIKAKNLKDIFQQLSLKKFGRIISVGDAFSGGGSIPFECARMGFPTLASDLNPVAGLLSWGSLKLVGGKATFAEEMKVLQAKIFDAVDRKIKALGFETSEDGLRGNAYLYCAEVKCPECDWQVPLLNTMQVGLASRTKISLKPNSAKKNFDFDIATGVSLEELTAAKSRKTVDDGNLNCPNCQKSTPISSIRGDRADSEKPTNVRYWEKDDFEPKADDTFQERLYCIRWTTPESHDSEEDDETEEEEVQNGLRFYRVPTAHDIENEKKISEYISQNWDKWKSVGLIPVKKIERGEKTDEPIRTRGWTYWHHLFRPRQLLLLALLLEEMENQNLSASHKAGVLLAIGRCANWNTKLCRWGTGAARESLAETFYNQALNTLYSFGARGLHLLTSSWKLRIATEEVNPESVVQVQDARDINKKIDVWITDPPYADSINYHEITEFFLSWYEKTLIKIFPEWSTDSKRTLAISGTGHSFRRSMVDCYKNLALHMPDDGYQVVYFTHQNPSVWADLTLILWAAGLKVESAWCIATEIEAGGTKDGNHVQGTVVLILKKQTSDETAFIDELYPRVEDEVKAQLALMTTIDDKSDPNFGDSDYQLAAYAAALRVLTQYKSIEDIDVSAELSREYGKGEQSPIEKIIINAVSVACDYLIPTNCDKYTWKLISSAERLYLKGLEIESHGETRVGVYQELARGFGVRDYLYMLSSSKANLTRLKSATEFASRSMEDVGFGNSPTRHVLFAIREIVRLDNDVQAGKNWLRNELKDYWASRKHLVNIASYLATVGQYLESWKEGDANAARLLAGALQNDHA